MTIEKRQKVDTKTTSDAGPVRARIADFSPQEIDPFSTTRSLWITYRFPEASGK